MKKVLIGLAIILVLVLVAGAIILFFSKKAPAPDIKPDVTFPQSTTNNTVGTGSTNVRINIQTKEGKELSVLDFINNKETVPDVVNNGVYFLAGPIGYCLVDGTCPSGAASDEYTISFDKSDQSFVVVLLKESLKESRAHAEAFLISRLGVSPNQLCSLNYQVLVSNTANEEYSSYANIGFSMCQGAIVLP